MNNVSLEFVVVSKYDNKGEPLYQGKGGLVPLIMDALKFDTRTEAKYYHEKVHGGTNCIIERYQFAYQTT